MTIEITYRISCDICKVCIGEDRYMPCGPWDVKYMPSVHSDNCMTVGHMHSHVCPVCRDYITEAIATRVVDLTLQAPKGDVPNFPLETSAVGFV